MTVSRYDDIRKFLILRTIADSGSLQKASAVLKVTPSAVSQSLSSLEKKLGRPMFLREKGRLCATKDCKDLLEKAAPAFAALDDLFEPADAEKMQIGSLSLGSYESLAKFVLPEFVRLLRKDHPNVKTNFMISRTAEIVKSVRSGRLCTALVVESDYLDSLHLIEVSSDELGLYISRKYEHELNMKKVEDLGVGIISLASDGTPTYLKKFMRQLGSNVKVNMTCDSFEVLKDLAVEGLVASVLPKRIAKKYKEQLVEFVDFPEKQEDCNGHHKIYLASAEHCDQIEAKYLAVLAKEAFAAEEKL